MNELWIEDPQAFFNFFRMEPAGFDELVQRVNPRITKTDTHMRKALFPGLKIALTVRYLASGEKYPSLMYSFRAARNTICLRIPKVCEATVLWKNPFSALSHKNLALLYTNKIIML